MGKENRGFTLVELLVSISILSVVGIAIGSFLYVSTNQYRSANAEVDIQAEAQLVQSQLTNLVLGTARGMSAEADTLTLFNYDPKIKEKNCILIYFSRADHRLLYSRYILEENEPGSGIWQEEEGKKDLFFAQYVTDFSVKFCDKFGTELTGEDETEQIGQVKISIDYEQNGRKYQSDFNVTPRNPVIASDNVLLLYKDVE